MPTGRRQLMARQRGVGQLAALFFSDTAKGREDKARPRPRRFGVGLQGSQGTLQQSQTRPQLRRRRQGCLNLLVRRVVERLEQITDQVLFHAVTLQKKRASRSTLPEA